LKEVLQPIYMELRI